MRRPKAGSVTCRSSAARVKLRVFARLTKSSSHLMCMDSRSDHSPAAPDNGIFGSGDCAHDKQKTPAAHQKCKAAALRRRL
jgi:hypothetical protein